MPAQLVPYGVRDVVVQLESNKGVCTRTHGQRVVDRDKHHHKQLWSKDVHGGPYRKVVSASQDPLETSREPGYEVTRSGPTTNFVGNHMTQDAIDLVQAELEDHIISDLPLLQDKPHSHPNSIGVCQAAEQEAVTQPLDKYSWWDTGTSIRISIPIPTALAKNATAKCEVQHRGLNVCISLSNADPQSTCSRLKLASLYADVKPDMSQCHVDGRPIDIYSTEPCPGIAPAGNAAIAGTTSSQQQLCKNVLSEPEKNFDLATQPNQNGAEWSDNKLDAVAKLQVAVVHKCTAAVFITLAKANPGASWPTLTRPAPVQHCKAKLAAQPTDMAAVRRALIQQRQQKQAVQHTQAQAINAAPSGASDSARESSSPIGKLSADPCSARGAASGCELSSRTEATCKQSQARAVTFVEALQKADATSESEQTWISSEADPAFAAWSQQALLDNAQRLERKAEHKEAQGSHAEACAMYEEAIQQLAACSASAVADQMARLYCHMASCLLQTGQPHQAVKVCNRAEDLLWDASKCSTCITVLTTRALAYEQLDKFADGVADFAHILKLDANNQMAEKGNEDDGVNYIEESGLQQEKEAMHGEETKHAYCKAQRGKHAHMLRRHSG